MITNFETITEELTDEEKKIIPLLIKGFPKYTKDNPIKAPEVIRRFNEKGYKLQEPRLRKMVNFIRSKGILPLMGTSKGYYVSYDKNEINLQIKSLRERADSIYNSAQGLNKFLNYE